jgi:hypothetical protein
MLTMTKKIQLTDTIYIYIYQSIVTPDDADYAIVIEFIELVS